MDELPSTTSRTSRPSRTESSMTDSGAGALAFHLTSTKTPPLTRSASGGNAPSSSTRAAASLSAPMPSASRDFALPIGPGRSLATLFLRGRRSDDRGCLSALLDDGVAVVFLDDVFDLGEDRSIAADRARSRPPRARDGPRRDRHLHDGDDGYPPSGRELRAGPSHRPTYTVAGYGVSRIGSPSARSGSDSRLALGRHPAKRSPSPTGLAQDDVRDCLHDSSSARP